MRGGLVLSNPICTHCGQHRKLTRDHVIPTCLFVELSTDRSIKVPSCEDCNRKAEEGLLKSFLSLFDGRIASARLPELRHPQGVGDLRSFLKICTSDIRVAYPEERVTRLFKKVFQGLRRYLLGDDWTFVSADHLTLFSKVRDGERSIIRQLPLCVGGPNNGYTIPPAFEGEGSLTFRFRDFRFGMPEPEVILLRYDQSLSGNELFLFGHFQPPTTLEAEQGS
jgi:hypothetical protein